MKKLLFLACIGLLPALYAEAHRLAPVADTAIGTIKYIGKKILPYNMPYNGTTVGGLSGIDYDPVHKVYYLICDDRSERQPARFYTARLQFSQSSFDSVQIVGTTPLLRADGTMYPDTKTEAPDPEAMRYNPVTDRLVWSSEGERIVNKKDTILKDPGVYEITRQGKYIDSFMLPGQFHMKATENGPRRNGVFEGLGFTPDHKSLYVSLEEPRYEDGPQADLDSNGAVTRLIRFDARTRKPVAQFAYELDPVATTPIPPQAFKVNGISDILVLSDRQLLVIERSFSFGRLGCVIKVYLADVSHATDISQIDALKGTTDVVPAKKKLLFNFNSLDTYIDNIEGCTFGPRLPNGHRSLIFVADNNFAFIEQTQFFLFEVIP
ncbi:esterase-like activity of phytase family protein [Chitinophaga pendula]|uniref:esterase-like activity of phytase family protein n=1 Tax=Chitinophaga TaxID=79328 RepID=UPI000BAE9C57|nr:MULTISPECIES: esterase-like activity of phytase family protein [Chitinophaga]ASZ10259.1 hypothetical protein CK934_04320 [Chitinophaga sp. MD30]UCJ06782.1 esterase-like activity of phytase family protein [Chitinophaga pendula]